MHVFLLDPWWDPAVEAQAIDRAHRIGQARHVLAFRLIARDTVEPKILALRTQERDLAEAIITGPNSLLRSLTREALELLLSRSTASHRSGRQPRKRSLVAVSHSRPAHPGRDVAAGGRGDHDAPRR